MAGMKGHRSSRKPPTIKTPILRETRSTGRTILTRSRPEGIRWLRADGTPNWSQRVHRAVGDARGLASAPPRVVYKSTPIMGAAEEIHHSRVRGLVVARGSERLLEGIVLATDLVNYFGGGEYYQIVLNRHRDSIYSALRKEVVATIMNKTPITVSIDDDISTILTVMVSEGVGFIPVVYEDGSVYGVITERDIVRRFAEAPFDKKVEDYMTSTLVTVDVEATLKDAVKLMTRHGFRRLPAVSSKTNEIKGVVTAKDVVSFFGSHEAFKHSPQGKMSEALETRVYQVMTPGVITIDAKASVSDAARLMIEASVDSLIVVEGGEARGIITERDVLVALVVEDGTR